MLTIGVVGLGSMGKRRVRDLCKLGCNVVGYDIREDRAQECGKLFGISTFESEAEFFDNDLSALVISVPPDQHAYYYRKSFEFKLPFFSEANIFTPRAEWFEKEEKAAQVKTYPSATWKFHPLFQQIKENIISDGIKTVNSISYQYGGFLPSWHPWENYWEFYAGQRKTSAAREMVPFELEWLVDVFGRIGSVSAYKGQMGSWKTDMDDAYYLNLIFENGKHATVSIELHQVDPFRKGIISCQKNSYKFDVITNECIRYDLENEIYKKINIPGLRIMSGFNFEDIYYEEIKAFVLAVNEGAEYLKSWEEDRHLSNVLFAAEKSSIERKWIDVADIENDYDGFQWE